MIEFNQPYNTGKESENLQEVLNSGHVAGNGEFTKKCHGFFENRYDFRKVLLTTSCTDALEMCALILDLKPGDEVIVPSYTFVSTALAFARQGISIRFADSRTDQPNIDEESLESLITPKTRAIVVVHYAGVSCNMDAVRKIAERHKLFIIEDAAQAIESKYKDKQLGGIGHLGTFSFHETKNLHCGEGGLLIINDSRLIGRAEMIWEKGTNRSEFFRGQVNKYEWVDTGSSFLPSELNAAYLYAQLCDIDHIQHRRLQIWNRYYEELKGLEVDGHFRLASIPSYATNNAHMFYIVMRSLSERTRFIAKLKERGIRAVFHYQSLHQSRYYRDRHDGRILKEADRYSDCLVRLPLHLNLGENEIQTVVESVKSGLT